MMHEYLLSLDREGNFIVKKFDQTSEPKTFKLPGL